MIVMNTPFAKVAILATHEAQKTGDPIIAWQNASVTVFGKGTSQQLKGCPKNTFLGLCEAGKIKGIPEGNYTRSLKNKSYAIKAAEILSEQGLMNPRDLWKKVLIQLNKNLSKKHNAQMDVVLALYKNNLLND